MRRGDFKAILRESWRNGEMEKWSDAVINTPPLQHPNAPSVIARKNKKKKRSAAFALYEVIIGAASCNRSTLRFMFIVPVNPSRALAFTLLEITLAVAILAMMSVVIYRFVQSNLTALRVSSEASAADARYSGLRDLLMTQWQGLS